MIPGRMCENGRPVPLDREDFKKFAQGLVEAGKVAYKAAQSKNLDAMLEAGGTVPMRVRPATRCIATSRTTRTGARLPMLRLRRVADMAELFKPLHDLFFCVSSIENSIALRESQYVWSLFDVAHVVFMCCFAGLIVMMDLRLLGVGNMQTPFSQLQRRLFPWQMAAMACSAMTGSVLVFGDPMRFYANIFFWLKMLMMVIAGVNAMAFHYITYFSVDAGTTPGCPRRQAGGRAGRGSVGLRDHRRATHSLQLVPIGDATMLSYFQWMNDLAVSKAIGESIWI